MENNNQELSNQVNANNNQQLQPNNNKILIILMALIIVGLAGYIVYAKFIQKGDNPEPKPTNTEEKGNSGNTSYPNDKSTNERIYKTKDGSKILKILSIDDNVKTKHPTINFSGSLYLGEYNGELMLVSDEKKVDEFIVYNGKLANHDEYESCDFVVKNDVLLNFEYSLKEAESDAPYSYIYSVEHIGNKYYIVHNNNEVYDDNVNKLYDVFLDSDKKGNFYVYDGGYFKKIGQNGEIVKTGKNKFIYSNHVEDLIDGDNYYTIAILDKKAVFYDFDNDKTFDLGSSEKYSLCSDGRSYCGMMAGVSKDNSQLKIYIMSDNNEETIYYYDISNGKLTSN